MITSAGVGSGIDIESIITQLMQLEREPLDRLLSQEQSVSSSLSELGLLKSRLADLDDATVALSAPGQALLYPVESDDENVVKASTLPGYTGALGGYDLDVIQLAQSHQLSTDLFTAGADAVVAAGDWTFSVGTETFSVNVSGESATISGLRDAINAAPDNTGVTATVLNLTGGSRLILTSASSGTASQLTATSLFSETRAAADAQFSVDGFAASSASNSVNDVIPGLTLELQSTGTARLLAVRNTSGMVERLEAFASAYNETVELIDSLQQNRFRGDASLNAMRTRISSSLFKPLETDSRNVSLLSAGLTLTREGTLMVDVSEIEKLNDLELATLQASLTRDGDNLVTRFTDSLEGYLSSDGFFDSRKDSLDTRKRRYEQQAERMEYRLEQIETRYRRQFTAMDGIVARLQNDSLYLLDQLNSNSGRSEG